MTVPLVFYYDYAAAAQASILAARPTYFAGLPPSSQWGADGVDFTAFQAAGIKCLGLVWAGFEGTTPATEVEAAWVASGHSPGYATMANIKLCIDQMLAANPTMYGIAFEEVTASPDATRAAFQQELKNYCASKGLTCCFALWESTFSATLAAIPDLIMDVAWTGGAMSSSENTYKSKVLLLNENAPDAATAASRVIDAMNLGVIAAYSTDATGTATLPAWFADYVAALGGTTAGPSAPTNLHSVDITQTSFMLEWDDPPAAENVVRWRIYRDGAYLQEATLSFSTISGLSPNTSYLAGVAAVNSSNVEGPRSEVTVKTLSPAIPLPTSPQNLRSSFISQSSLTVAWDANPSGESVTEYIVHVKG